jgi:integrase
MANCLLTDKYIRALQPTAGRQYDVFDSKVRGLSVRVSPKGTKAFNFLYRMGYRTRRLKLGIYDELSLSDARTKATKARQAVAEGIDPAALKIRSRKQYDDKLFPAFVELFIEQCAKHQTRSWNERARILRREFVGPWSNLTINQITKRHVTEVIDGILKKGFPSAANHAFAAGRRVFSWAVERGEIDVSPFSGLRAPSKNKPRERVLNDAELLRIWLAAEQFGYPFGSIVRVLLLTGQRRDEVTSMGWGDIDVEKAIWTLPGATNKSGRVHLVPLSPFTVELLTSLPKVHAKWIFPARGKDNPASGWSRWKAKPDSLCGVTDWTLHDLRRTVATRMAELDVEPHVIERILNHATGGVAAIYNRYPYLPKMRAALDIWTRHLQDLLAMERDSKNRAA